MKTVVFLLIFIVSTPLTWAFTISNSGTEVSYSYSMEYRTIYPRDYNRRLDPKKLASNHAYHLDGLFHSPEYAKATAGYDVNLIQGFAGTVAPTITRAQIIKDPSDPYLRVQYEANGKMIVLKKVADAWFQGRKSAQIKLPLLQDFTEIYEGLPSDPNDYDHFKKFAQGEKWLPCTDDHYTDPFDFSYFYDPFRKLKPCQELGKEPLAKNVVFNLKDESPSAVDYKTKIPKDKVFGDNENGPLVTLYFVNGFSEEYSSSSSMRAVKGDFGFLDFKQIEKNFVETLGFTKFESTAEFQKFLGSSSKYINLNNNPVALNYPDQRRFFATYGKEISGKLFVVRNAIFYTGNEVKSRPLFSFPKFWKEAWENADIIYYGGHSGDGIALSNKTMLTNLKKSKTKTNEINFKEIKFNPKKEQIVFFDSCSSYAYYVDEYAKHKPNATSILTYGVVSLFPVALATLDTFIQEMMSPRPQTWLQLLSNIEHAQLKPMMESIYAPSSVAAQTRKHEQENSYPNFLISVWAP